MKSSWLDDGSINNYIVLFSTCWVIEHDNKYEELRKWNEFDVFNIAMKNLNNACNIPDTMFDDFSNQNITQTRDELFNEKIWNTRLIELRENSIKNHNSEYEKLFEVENDEELIQKYGRFLDRNWRWRQLYENRLQNKLYDDEDYSELLDCILFKQKEIENNTKDIIEELCITSQIKWFLDCIPSEYSDEFQFNKANEINVKDGILQLDWHVNWVNFSLRQDTNDFNAHLQTSTMLSRDQDNNLNFMWKYNDSPFGLPTATQVFDTAILCAQSDNLLKIQNQDDYFDVLQDSILDNMDKLYRDTKFVRPYIKGQIKNWEVMNETMQIYKQIWWWNIESLSKVSNEKLYNFFDTIDFNLSVMTNREKQKFLECMKILWEKITRWWNVAWSDTFSDDGYLANFLWSKEQTEQEIKWLWWLNNGKSFFDLFSLFYNNSDERNESWNRRILDLNKLNECLVNIQYAQTLWEDIDRSNMDDWLNQELMMA